MSCHANCAMLCYAMLRYAIAAFMHALHLVGQMFPEQSLVAGCS